MPDDSWRRVEELFLAALDVPAEKRAAFLERECGGDAELRSEAESLLAADEAGGQRIAMVVETSAANLLDRDGYVGRRLGTYELVEEIGRGGMGAVYAAVRADREYEKRVAVKLMKRGLDTDAVLERFRHERQILAGLEHPYITTLLDGGTSPDGLPYFVMELVEGKPIQEYCRAANLDVRERCKLFIKVCDAVAYAHRNLVIHRDLKPANILVTADGTPKLLDFGIARLLSIDPGEQETIGAMTPAYASPEQIRGEAVNTSTDVYSLGAVLREVLSSEGERDLQNIVQKAMHTDQSQRYHSVDHFAEDLERYLSGQPVLARGDNFIYRTRKFLWRHRLAATAAVLVVASLAAGLGLSIAAHHKTQKRFDQVRALANSILFELHDEIAKLPGSTKARSMVLQKAFTYLEGLAQDAAGDMTLQMDLARAYVRVGELQSRILGDGRNAMTSFSKAIEIARRASSSQPGELSTKLLLVEALSGLGRQESLAGMANAGRRDLDESSRILGLLIADSPKADVDSMELAVRESIVLSGLARNEGEYQRALKELRQAVRSIELLRRISTEDKADYWESLANWNLAIVQSQTGDLSGAHLTLERAAKTISGLAARHAENATYERQIWVVRHARALFAGSPRSVNEGDSATSLALYQEAQELHRRNWAADEANIRYHVDYIAANFGVALVTSEVDPEKGLKLLEENVKLCLALSGDALETNLSNFSVALVYRTAALTAAKLKRWTLAREYQAKAAPVQEALLTRKPYYLTKLEHASFLREAGLIEGRAGSKAVAIQRYQAALAELQAIEDHRSEIFWVWKTSEALEGLAEVKPDEACALYRRSFELWSRWRAEGGPDSSFFRSHLDRAQRLTQGCTRVQSD